MNIQVSLYTLFICVALFLASCSNDDDIPGGIEPTEHILNAFQAHYPNGKNARWKISHDFYVVEFQNPLVDTRAWFTETGIWMMDETDLPLKEIPHSVTEALRQSEYASWIIDEAAILHRSGMTFIYKIEVKNEKQERILYYSRCGNLIKTVEDTKNYEEEPIFIPEQITNLMTTIFPDAALLYMETDANGSTLYLLDGTTYKIARLNSEYFWQHTTWQVTEKEVPALVLEKFETSEYGNDPVRSLWIWIDAKGEFYLFEVLRDGRPATVKLDVFGNIVPA